MEEKIITVASKVTKPISIASICIIVVYLIYKAMLNMDVFSVLSENSTFVLLDGIASKIFILAIIALFLGTISYIFSVVQKNSLENHSQNYLLSGNVYFENEHPVESATVFVEGVDRRKLTDDSGWFQIEVPKRNSWTIRAYYEDKVASSVIKQKNVDSPIRIIFPKVKPRT